MISDLDVIRACRDAQACMTPPSSLEALARRQGITEMEALDAMVCTHGKGYITWTHIQHARPTEAGLRLLREAGE